MKKIMMMFAVLSMLGLASCQHMGMKGSCCSDKKSACSADKNCSECKGPKEADKDSGGCADCKK